MSILSREILKWIQSLDLTYSVRNVRRDFANGFLVAEILSRFKEYSSDINMHSFDNGTAIARRKDNWQQLLKIFKKREVPIDEDLANAVLHCKAMAAVQMVEKLYGHLTKRSIAPTETVFEETPAYAKPTASKVVKDKMKEPVAVEEKDQLASTSYAQDALEQHQMQLRQDRMNDRERFTHTSKHRMEQRMLRVATRQVQQNDFKQPQIQFLKTVNVKPITEGMTHMRSRFGSLRPSNANSPTNSSLTMSQNVSPQLVHPETVAKTVGSTRNETIASVMEPVIQESLEIKERLSLSDFCDSISSRSADDVVKVFDALVDDCLQQCVAVAMDKPKQFWKLAGILCKSFAGTSERGLDAVVDFILCFAEMCGKQDKGEASDLFQDYMLPKSIVLFKTIPSKREQIADIMGAFCFSDSQLVTLLKVLKEDLDNTSLVECFSYLSISTTYRSRTVEDVLFFYVSNGLRSTSKQIRTNALTILASLCKQSPNLCLNLLDDLKKLIEDPWWGIKSGVAHVLCASTTAILSGDGGQDDKAAAESLQQILEGILKGASPIILRTCLYWMADCLPEKASSNPGAKWMRNLFMSTISTAPADMQLYLCGMEDESKTSDANAAVAGRGPLPSRKALGIAGAVMENLIENKKKNLEEVHVRLLCASVLKVKRFDKHSAREWEKILEGLTRYILVEFLDVQRCSWAATILDKFFLDDTTRDFACTALLRRPPSSAKAPKFFGFLKMVFPESPPQCKEAVESFIGELVSNHSSMHKDIYNLLKNFEAAEPERYGTSNLNKVMSNLKGSL